MAELAINILVVEQHQLIRQAICKLLHQIASMRVICEAANGEEAIRLARKYQPDVILLNFHLPDISGLEVIRRLTTIPARIVILTSGTADFITSRLLRTGICGYITKSANQEQLLKAIYHAYYGQSYILTGPVSSARLLTTQKQSLFRELSDRELEIMLMLMRGASLKTIARSLHLQVRTINDYRYRVFEKLGVKNNVELIHLAKHYRWFGDEKIIDMLETEEIGD